MTRLTSHLIGRTALAIVDERGPDGLTLRAVADRLEVTPMALYHHVDGKAGLAGLVVSIANSEMPLGELDVPWDEELHAIACWSRNNRLRHPGVNALRVRYNVFAEIMPDLAGRWVRCWQHSGLEGDAVVLAALTSSSAVSGLIEHELQSRGRPALPADRVETMSPEARTLLATPIDYDTLFDLGVRAIIEGVHARQLRAPSKPDGKRPPGKRAQRGLERVAGIEPA
jgi:AcrR family transcriptional regulator